METLLIDQWLRRGDCVLIHDEAALTTVRDWIKDVAVSTGVASDVADRACLIATELGRNHIRHAKDGRIAIRPLTRGEHRGLEILGADRGRGLEDPASALDAKPRAHGTLGVGIGSIRRLSSEVDFDIRICEGTKVVARVLDRHVPRGREVGVYGRPIQGETISGDHASFYDSKDALVVAVCDGLGHGPLAREAADAAVAAFDAHPDLEADRIIDECHERLRTTRGAVLAVARIAHDRPSVLVASVGNIGVQVCSSRYAKRLGGTSAILGGRVGPKVRTETAAYADDQLLVLSTDGIASMFAVEQDLALLRQHPIVVAQRIVERFQRTNDDALVLVVR